MCPIFPVFVLFLVRLWQLTLLTLAGPAIDQIMRSAILVIVCSLAAFAAPKVHTVSFGKTISAKWYVGTTESQSVDLKVRPLFVDGRLKEYTVGSLHEITERLFVVQRAYRVNDALPQDKVPEWRWQRGSWMMVDRVSGKVSPVGLPEFDTYYSAASWYRDYAAYCGISNDGRKLFAIVAQLSRRKPLLKKALGEAQAGELPDSECPVPLWERPTMVTFIAKDQKFSYSIHGHAVDMVPENENSDSE